MNDETVYRDLVKPLKKLAKVPQARLGGVACFIIKNNAIVSSGINYNPTGGPMEDFIDGTFVTRPEVIHAEAAALAAAHDNAIDLAGSTLLITMSPCLACAKKVATSGIQEMVYLYDWWDKASLRVLKDAGITTKKWTEEA